MLLLCQQEVSVKQVCFIISFNGHLIGSSSGHLSIGSRVEVRNLGFGDLGRVYNSSEETECLCRQCLVTVIFSVPSMSESESELLL